MSETTIDMTQPPPPAAPKLLRRSSTDRIFGGVCGGLGRYWNVDPVVLRVVFGVSLLLGGFGLFAYLAMWLLIPDESASPTARISESWGLRIVGAGIAFMATMIGLGLLFSDAVGGGGVFLAALLAGVVVWIVMSQRAGTPAPQVAAAAPADTVGYAYGGGGDYTPTTALPQPPVPPAPPRERSYLGLIGLFAAMAASGLAILFGAGATVVLAAALLALGVTMLVGAFVGRAKWLLIFAIPLLMLLSAVAQVERADLSAGQRVWEPTGSGDTYSLTLGTVDVDFSRWQGLPTAGDQVRLDMGVGEVRVAAPRNWELEVVSTYERADITIDGERARGERIAGDQVTVIPASSGDAEGTLRLEIDMEAGDVIVETGAPAVGEPELDSSPKTEQKEQKQQKQQKSTNKEKAA